MILIVLRGFPIIHCLLSLDNLTRIAELVTLNPVKCRSLYLKKGSIVMEVDADLAVIDLETEKTVSPIAG